MITHANLCASLAASRSSLFEGLPMGGELVAFLPLCHIAERLIGEYVPIHRQSTINFVENPETVFENLREEVRRLCVTERACLKFNAPSCSTWKACPGSTIRRSSAWQRCASWGGPTW